MTGPVPARVDAHAKDVLLGLIDHAVGQGWSLGKACRVLGLDPRRVHRWIGRRHRRDLGDHRPGASLGALLAQEVDAIVEVFDTWGERDRSHRRLAHRGSYIGRFWASPSTVRRVLTLRDKHFRPLPRPAKGARRPFPDWASYRPNSIWIHDLTHVTRCGMTVLIIEDLVSRKWLTHLVSVEETHTQVENAFMAALEAEDLLAAALERAGTGRVDPALDDGRTPILLAVSDNGSQMIARDTRKFMALVAIAQHFGRPCTPTDRAWIESLNGHHQGRVATPAGDHRPRHPAGRARPRAHRVQHRATTLRHRLRHPRRRTHRPWPGHPRRPPTRAPRRASTSVCPPPATPEQSMNDNHPPRPGRGLIKPPECDTNADARQWRPSA